MAMTDRAVVDFVPTAHRGQRIATLIEEIEKAGSGSLAHFGYPCRPDGLYLQQDPQEFAAFIAFLETELGECDLSLDLGIASGGQTKFVRDRIACRNTIIVDIGQHPDFANWERIKRLVRSTIVLELIADSHSSEVKRALAPFKGKVDFAYIDGDHSYRGLRKDIFLIRELLRPGALMALHDTLAVPECARVHGELLGSSYFEHVRDFHNRFGISLWRMKRPARTSALNFRFGVGAM